MNELEMKQDVVELSNQVAYLNVKSDEDYKKIAEFLKLIKEHRRNITLYWGEAKESSRSAYKAILSKEKEMLRICDEAEKLLKGKLIEYKQVQEQIQVDAQIEAERLAKKEAESLLNQAVDLEQNGDNKLAEMKMIQAEMVSNLTPKADLPIPKIEGLGTQRRWKCRITDNELVPAFFNGIEIRDVNLKRILEIRKKEPSIKIPGIEFYQDEIITIR